MDGQAIHPQRGAAVCGHRREAAGAVAQNLSHAGVKQKAPTDWSWGQVFGLSHMRAAIPSEKQTRGDVPVDLWPK
jgi:hypothetical protein